MSVSVETCAEASSGFFVGSRSLARWVSCNNPFYAISAMLVCVGLWVSFGGQAQAAQMWALMAGLTGYTLLMAVTACLLVRFLGVWDDVRTVMLLTVLMFLSTSVTFDQALAEAPMRGMACYGGGFLFALVVSEGMLHGVGLRLPGAFRGPYYLILALFYLYPVALVPLLDQAHDQELEWALFGFSPLAGLVALTLLPAVRLGRRYLREKDNPWPWAWYPWTLFGVLGFGVLARSPLLCWSMHHLAAGETEPFIFGYYFLIPFLFAVAILLLEIGIVEKKSKVLHLALGMPAILVILASIGHRTEVVYCEFLGQFEWRMGGTPLYVTLLASLAFFVYAWGRGVEMASTAVSVALLSLVCVGPATRDLSGLIAPQPLPLMCFGVFELALGCRRRSSWRCLVGSFCLVAAGFFTEVNGIPTVYHTGAIYHLLLLSVLLLGAVFDDALGRWLRIAGSALAVLGCLLVMVQGGDPSSMWVPVWVHWVYPLAMCLVLAAYGRLIGNQTAFYAAGLILASWVVGTGWRGYQSVQRLAAGFNYIVLGMISLSLAWLTSLAKAGRIPWLTLSRTQMISTVSQTDSPNA
jgi:hypothetical protein